MFTFNEIADPDIVSSLYDLRTLVPGAADVIGRFSAESERLRHEGGIEISREAFGPTKSEYLEIIRAKGASSKQPAQIFIHGGYWRAFSAEDFSFVGEGLAARGICTVNLNYALCPKVRVSEIVRQARAAVAWIWKNADRLNIDANRLFVVGHSAGAQIGAMLLATDWKDFGLETNPLAGGALLSGVYDLRPIANSWLQPALRLDQFEVLEYSPIFNPPSRACKIACVVGSNEPPALLKQADEYCEFLEKVGAKYTRLSIEGRNHFDLLFELSQTEGSVSRLIEKWAREH